MADSTPFGVHSEVRQLRKVLVRTRARPPASHADDLRPAAVRRRDMGREREARPPRLRAEDARQPGKYEATVVATDAAGQQSAPVTVRFRIAGR